MTTKYAIPKFKYKKVDGVKIAYRETGEGKPTFCIPGFGSSSAYYIPLLNALNEPNSKYIVPDIPGLGGASQSLGKTLTIEKIAELVYKFIFSFKINKFNLLGYSFGGAVAQILYQNLGLKPERLILISTLNDGKPFIKEFPFSLFYKAFLFRKKYYLPKFIFKLLLLLEAVPHLRLKHFKKTYQYGKISKTVFYDLLRIDTESLISAGVSAINFKANNNYPKKTMVIYAENDFNSVIKDCKMIADKAKTKPIVILKENHLHGFFNPQKSAKHIKKFLKET